MLSAQTLPDHTVWEEILPPACALVRLLTCLSCLLPSQCVYPDETMHVGGTKAAAASSQSDENFYLNNTMDSDLGNSKQHGSRFPSTTVWH